MTRALWKCGGVWHCRLQWPRAKCQCFPCCPYDQSVLGRGSSPAVAATRALVLLAAMASGGVQ